MTKTELYSTLNNELTKIYKNHKVTKEVQDKLQAMLDNYIKPKSGGSTQKHPPKVDENNNIVEAYCRYYQKYFPVDEYVMSGGKPKGYSKVGNNLWNKTQRTIQKLSSEFVDLDDLTSDTAKEIKTIIELLKSKVNDPESYKDGSLDKLVNQKED